MIFPSSVISFSLIDFFCLKKFVRFCCSGCGSYIVGTRYHCNVCEDFDLCTGCRSSGNVPER